MEILSHKDTIAKKNNLQKKKKKFFKQKKLQSALKHTPIRIRAELNRQKMLLNCRLCSLIKNSTEKLSYKERQAKKIRTDGQRETKIAKHLNKNGKTDRLIKSCY